MDIKTILENAKKDFLNAQNENELMLAKTSYLGKKSPINEILANMKSLSVEEKKEIGLKVNQVKKDIEDLFNQRREELKNQEVLNKINSEAIDVTLPGAKVKLGTLHPLTQTIMEMEDMFLGMGYEIADGPEIEEDYYNFELLNLPHDHPARDMQDSFYIDVNHLLRTQTSAIQAREMLKRNGKPIKLICPGKTYRRDMDDATHSHQFMQMEGLVIGPDISIADLKGSLLAMANQMFGEGRKIRLRPSYFPFTEPSVEVDVSCARCNGAGCNMCKGTGYIEVLGAGMVNRHVLEMCGYDKELQGFAFGIGIERVAMLKDKIEDIRNFYLNDTRFLEQFKEVK